jgi:hypothetical protein
VLDAEVICDINVNKYQVFIVIGFVDVVVILCVENPFVTTLTLPVLENNPPQYPSKLKLDDNLPNTGIC